MIAAAGNGVTVKQFSAGIIHCLPQSVKLAVIRNNIPTPRPRVFIETGTYYGDTVAAVKDMYSSVISIEVDEALYKKACVRFADDKNVRIAHGDCAKKLPEILARCKSRRYSGSTGITAAAKPARAKIEDPILISLNQIAAHPVREHVIFIDDARTFDGREGRPDISEVFNCIKKIDSRYIIRVQSDIIVATVTAYRSVTEEVVLPSSSCAARMTGSAASSSRQWLFPLPSHPILLHGSAIHGMS